MPEIGPGTKLVMKGLKLAFPERVARFEQEEREYKERKKHRSRRMGDDGDGGEQHQRQGPPSIHSNANGQDSGSRSEDDDDAPRESVRRGTSGRSFIAEDSGEGRSRHQSRHGGSRSIQYQPSRHTPSRTSQHPLSHIEESRASQQQPSHTPSRTSQHQQHQPSLTHTISRGSGHHSRDMTGLQYSRDDNTRPDRSRHGTRSESIREIGSSRSNNLRITEGES